MKDYLRGSSVRANTFKKRQALSREAFLKDRINRLMSSIKTSGLETPSTTEHIQLIRSTIAKFEEIQLSPYISIDEKTTFFERLDLNNLSSIQRELEDLLRDASVRKAMGVVMDDASKPAPSLAPIPTSATRLAEAELKQLDTQIGGARTEALRDLTEWDKQPLVLQANECSRLHKVVEQVKADEPDAVNYNWDVIEPFVVKHNWLAAFGDSLGAVQPGELKLPYPMSAFEFKLSNRVLIVIVSDNEITHEGAIYHWFFEGKNGTWCGLADDSDYKFTAVVKRHIAAICVMLDSKVAESDVIRQPIKLQEARKVHGKLPLYDYRVIDLSRRHRASRLPNPTHTGRHKRCHFRRGHWRHLTTHKTWINWMLVGDQDLGFVDKEYRL